MLLSQFQKIIYNLKRKILTVAGDIKFYSKPLWFIYDPKGYKLKGDSFDEVSKKVKKYDVLLNRFDNWLDVGFIPGFWNHAGIVSGSNSDVNPSIIHAISDGVVCETLFDYLHTDSLCVLRPKFKVDGKEFERRIELAKTKEYDFNFDFSDGDRLSCTELVEFMYKDMFPGFSRTDIWGRPGIIPDTVRNSDSFELILEIKK